MLRRLCVLLVLFVPAGRMFASVALLLEEPFGKFGYVNPTGHAAIYLSRVCAESPTKLRRCAPGEYGVVISRYHHVDGRDWLAIPLIPYLYAVDRVADIPETASSKTESDLRDAWRRKHLEELVPDTKDGRPPGGEWTELIGSLYDRKIFVYELDTTDQQDDAFIRAFNLRANRSHFNLFFHNCADFSRNVLDLYYPHSARRSYSADLGMSTPKQIAKSLVRYGARHERLGMQEFVLPQVAGGIPRSKQVDGVLEAILRKKYVLPIVILHPYVAAGVALTYFTGGRFNPGKNAVTLDQDETIQAMWLDEPPPSHGPGLISSGSGGRTSQRGNQSATLFSAASGESLSGEADGRR